MNPNLPPAIEPDCPLPMLSDTTYRLADDSDDYTPPETSTAHELAVTEEVGEAIPGWFVDIAIEDRPAALVGLSMIPAIDTLADKEKKKELTRQFITLVKSGIDPVVAARRMNKFLPTRGAVRNHVKHLLENYTWSADADRAIVRAGNRKIALDAMDKGDDKIALAALAAIAKDPDVGLNAPPSTTVNVNMGNLGKVFEAVESDGYQVIDVGEEAP